MPLYEVQQHYKTIRVYEVEADSETEAIFKVINCDGDFVLIDILDNEENTKDGMSADVYPELAGELSEMGIYTENNVIPSIRYVKLQESE